MANRKTTTSDSPPSPWRRRLLVAAAVAIVAIVGALAIARHFSPGDSTPGGSDTASIGGPFILTDQNGKRVSDTDFRGKYMLVYFGYTYCPDICPLSLVRNAEALAMLGDQANRIIPIMITVDPERDTAEHLKDYVSVFDPRLIGLTGTPDEIKTVAKEYRVYYAKVVPKGTDPDNYLVDHSGFSYLMDPDGNFVQFFRHDMSAEDMAERLRKIL